MQLNIPDEAGGEILLQLATERGQTPEEYVIDYVNNEDQRRHTRKIPHYPEERVNCGAPLCKEKQYVYSEEIKEAASIARGLFYFFFNIISVASAFVRPT